MRASKTDKMWTECDMNVSGSECAVCVQFSNSCLGNRQLKQGKTDLIHIPPSTYNSITTDFQSSHITSTNADFTDNTTPVIYTAAVNDELDHTIQHTSVLISQTSLDTTNDQTNTSINNERKQVNFSQSSTQTTPRRRKQTNEQTNISTSDKNQANVSQSTTQTTPQRKNQYSSNALHHQYLKTIKHQNHCQIYIHLSQTLKNNSTQIL
ncbi:hypothetical protein PoB_002350500 [Plakobranchus ocellatus]|uniref:Uncharacterized protein n=1 Tax=Plakobranchus ocellatus TaxID=259542 RepID=A0AAV3ZQX9_9GAST|nr:hypothetical protein PoB_002350500 [Plakobranchus ocellatus]